MSTKLSLLEVLDQSPNTYLSGQELADRLHLSRNAVWKAIKKLQEQGFPIEAKTGIGYRLLQRTDILSPDYLKERIATPCRIQVHETVASTMQAAQDLDCSEKPWIVVANEQTKGRGRLGRDFYSPANTGLYMTIAFRPQFGLDMALFTTITVAVAVCRAVEQVAGLYPKIKWVNDIYLGGKKVCGIITEARSHFETGNIDKLLIGIGINCFPAVFPPELADTVTYLENPKKKFSRNQLAAAIVDGFFSALAEERGKVLREYKMRSFILGEQILIYDTIRGQSPGDGSRGIRARAIDIDDNGGLVVEYMEGRRMREMETITTGEISIRRVD